MKTVKEKIESVAIEDIAPYDKNYNKHPDEQINEIANSIERFGFLNPILVDKNYNIVAGHGRYIAAMQLGIDHVPVLKADHLNEKERRAYLIADNRIARHSKEDLDVLKDEVFDLGRFYDIDLTVLGFSDKELEKLLPDNIGEPEKETFEKPEPRGGTDSKVKKALLDIPMEYRDRMIAQVMARGDDPWGDIVNELEENESGLLE